MAGDGRSARDVPEGLGPRERADLTVLLREERLGEARTVLHDLRPHEVAAELEHLPGDLQAVAFRLLDKQQALATFESLDPGVQRDLLEHLREDRVTELVEGLDPDDRARLFDEVPAGVAQKLLRGLSAPERRYTTALLGYPPDSVGRLMSPEVVAVPVDVDCGSALDLVRRRGRDAETVYLVPVVGPGRVLEGVVSLRSLVLADAATPVRDVMRDPLSAPVSTDQEEAARLVQEADLIALPVVDSENRLVGVFTVDDAMEVLEAEATEDAARAGATEPLRRPYLSTSVPRVVRSRVVWLFVLVLAATLTVGVLDAFEAELEAVVALALFVPLLIGTGGNVGAQAATTVVRAMAVGEVRFRDLGRVVGREALTGLLLGSTLAVVGFAPAAWFAGVHIAAVLAVTLVGICALAACAGAFMPLLARRVGVDPAVVSAPFITTFVDASGLVLYFLVARAVLPEL
jgi:magnesium transporter